MEYIERNKHTIANWFERGYQVQSKEEGGGEVKIMRERGTNNEKEREIIKT